MTPPPTSEVALIAATARELFEAHGGAWAVLDEYGMTRVALPEPVGAGGEPAHLAVLLRTAGWAGVSVPLLETHVGASLLAAAGLPDEGGSIGVALDPGVLGLPGGPPTVSFAGLTDWVVVARPTAGGVGGHPEGEVSVALWRTADLEWSPSRTVAGDPVASAAPAALSDAADPAGWPAPTAAGTVSSVEAERLALLEVLGRTFLLVGAGERALEHTLTYVAQREQFGRALARFQAVQQTVAVMASLVAAAAAATEAALTALTAPAVPTAPTVPAAPAVEPGRAAAPSAAVRFAVLAARSQADRMARQVARSAHQLHGALGFTDEHALHRVTTRLSAWRTTWPSEAALDTELARIAADDPWRTIAGA
ncbi:acyl-CoA dehydrogenase family protein [Cryptosporangium sp. NPDC048952]|uniref:acyl-CoA dehydrogenase family protein n=1 Tax=Cryptosporangium sp. NPDC048952 TaxID=3363961 RepID=UPI00371A1417